MRTLDLRESVVNEFWRKQDQSMPGALAWMDRIETWTLDNDPGFEQAIAWLTPLLEQTPSEVVKENSANFLHVMAYLSSSRALRLLAWLGQHHNDFLTLELVEEARANQNDPPCHLMLDRLRTLQSMALLAQVFSPQRLHMLTQMLRETSRGHGGRSQR